MSNEGKIRIGENIRIIPGYPFNSRLFNSDGDGLPLIRIRDLLKSKIETFYSGEFSDEFTISEGDILIGMDGDFHIVKWQNKRKALLNQRIMKVAQKQGALIDIKYFYYFLSPFLKNIHDKTTATTVKHLSTYDISNAFEKFPPLSEQSQIALILNTADSVIEKTKIAIAKYKAIKKGMLQDLSTRGIDIQTGKLRPKIIDAPELYKESKLGMIPKEWDAERLGNRAIIEYGKSQKDVVSINGTIPVYGTGGLMEYAIDYLFDGESILIGRKGTIDKPFYITGKFWTVDTAYYLSSFKGNVRWLYYQLEKYDLKRLNEATGVPSINREQLYDIQIAFPQKNEQDEIVKRVYSIDKKLNTEQNCLLKIQLLKAGLMADLLNGKKVVKVEKSTEIVNQ
ncbi:MAG: restriction endonuclease subunit S [bacterium]|nr:restriction endonuclease subunit S [bacterium]